MVLRIPFLILAAMPTVASAREIACLIPDALPKPRIETPPLSDVNHAPATGYVLALSWSPQFCRDRSGMAEHAPQCGGSSRFGFILHGLWPDGDGRADPAWCRPVRNPIDRNLVRRNFCMTPSADLQQHEWAKHGSCMSATPEAYFKASSILYGALKWPDMDALSRARPNVAAFKAAFARANPGVLPSAIAVQTTSGGWLKSVNLCLAMDFRTRACPRGDGGAPPRTALKIWRSVR